MELKDLVINTQQADIEGLVSQLSICKNDIINISSAYIEVAEGISNLIGNLDKFSTAGQNTTNAALLIRKWGSDSPYTGVEPYFRVS